MRSFLWGWAVLGVAIGAVAVASARADDSDPATSPAGTSRASDCEQSGCEAGCCRGCGCGAGGWVAPCPDCYSGIFGGIEVGILKPHFRSNNIAFVSTQLTGNGKDTRGDYFDYRYEASPRIWLGYMGDNCFGGRVRWWFFDHASNAETFTAAAGFNAFTPDVVPLSTRQSAPLLGTYSPGDTLTAFSNLRLYTLDAELMQRLNVCAWRINLGGGLRHLSIAQDFAGLATHVNPVGAVPLNTETLFVHHSFDGVGPTAFAELNRPFGSTGLAFVCNLRGSLAYGDAGIRALQARSDGPRSTWDFSHQGSTMTVADLGIGVEWSRQLSNGAALVVQALWECQYWWGTGSAISPHDDDMGLTGFTLQLGITR